MYKEQRDYMVERITKLAKVHADNIKAETEKAISQIPSAMSKYAADLEKSKELQAKALGNLVAHLKKESTMALDMEALKEYAEENYKAEAKLKERASERLDELKKETMLLMDRCMLTEDGEALCKLIKAFEAKSF